jgi:RNA methyltransferase, TrmH family
MTRPKKPVHARAEPATERVVGLAAVRAVLEARPKDVLNIAHGREARQEVREILRLAAQHRIAYRELPQDDLDRLADTVHHEGICMLTRVRPVPALQDMVKRLADRGFVLALDRVDNPHNVGAILRTAAFFGARGLLVATRDDKSLTPAMVRIAEGGAERVPVLFTVDLPGALNAFAAAEIAIIGADGRARTSLAELAWPARCVIVMGSERSGMSEGVRKRCTHQVRIDGTGHVESLNVSVAAVILMAARVGAAARVGS